MRRGQHDALDALTVGIKTSCPARLRHDVNWVLDADISRFWRATIKVRHSVNQGETAPGWADEGRA